MGPQEADRQTSPLALPDHRPLPPCRASKGTSTFPHHQRGHPLFPIVPRTGTPARTGTRTGRTRTGTPTFPDERPVMPIRGGEMGCLSGMGGISVEYRCGGLFPMRALRSEFWFSELSEMSSGPDLESRLALYPYLMFAIEFVLSISPSGHRVSLSRDLPMWVSPFAPFPFCTPFAVFPDEHRPSV